MPEPYLLLSFATMGESHGVGTGAAGFGGAAAGLAAAEVAGAAAAGFAGVTGVGGAGGAAGLAGGGFRFRLSRAGGTSFHPARGRGLIRRRLRFTIRRRRSGGFSFVRHNAKAQTSGAECVEKNVNFYQLEEMVSTLGARRLTQDALGIARGPNWNWGSQFTTLNISQSHGCNWTPSGGE